MAIQLSVGDIILIFFIAPFFVLLITHSMAVFFAEEGDYTPPILFSSFIALIILLIILVGFISREQDRAIYLNKVCEENGIGYSECSEIMNDHLRNICVYKSQREYCDILLKEVK